MPALLGPTDNSDVGQPKGNKAIKKGKFKPEGLAKKRKGCKYCRCIALNSYNFM